MASLNAHLLEAGDHGRLGFHQECPVCRRERLYGALSTEPVISRRTQAALASGVLALTTAAPAAAQAPPSQEGGAAPQQPAAGAQQPESGVSSGPGLGVSQPDSGVPQQPDSGVPQQPGGGGPQPPDSGVPQQPGGGASGPGVGVGVDSLGSDPGGGAGLPLETAPSPAAPDTGGAGGIGADGVNPVDSAPLETEPLVDPDAGPTTPAAPGTQAPTTGQALQAPTTGQALQAPTTGQALQAPAPDRARPFPPAPPTGAAEPSPLGTNVPGGPEPSAPEQTAPAPSPPTAGSEPRPESQPGERPSTRSGDGNTRARGDTGTSGTSPGDVAPNVPPSPEVPAGEPVGLVPVSVPEQAPVDQPNPGAAHEQASSEVEPLRGDIRSHVVEPGDSLWSIAKRMLAPGASTARIAREVARLWELNKDRIGTGDPDLLAVGTKLRLR